MLKKQILWSLLEKIIKSIVAIITLSLVSKSIAISDFGNYVTLVSLGGVFLALTNIGAESLIPKIISNNENGSEFYLLKIGGMFLFAIIFFILCRVYYPSIDIISVLIMLMAFLCYFFNYSEYIANQKGKIELYSKISIAVQCISLMVKLLYVHFFDGVIIFWLVVFALEYFFTGYLSYIFLDEKISISNIDKNKLGIMAKNVSYILLSSATVAAYMRIDTLMISYYLGSDAAGKYFAGSRLSEGVYFIGISIANVLYSQTLRNKNKGADYVTKEIKKFMVSLFLLGVAGTVFIHIFSKLLIDILYGEGFEVSISVLTIHSISIAFVFIGGYLSRLYINCGYAKKNFRRTFFSLLMNVALVTFLIPRFGVLGAAYAMVLSQVFSSFVMFVIDRKFMKRLMIGDL